MKTNRGMMRGFGPGLLVALGLACGCESNSPGVQGSGVAAVEERTPEPFTRVEQMGSAAVEIDVGAAQRVRVEADDNVVPLIETRTVEGALCVSSTESYSAKAGVMVRISAPTLTGVNVVGSGDLRARGVVGDRFAATTAGSGAMNLAGAVGDLELRVSGSGDIDATGLAAARVTVHISGSSSVTIHASERVEAHITGSGSLRYAGSPKEVTREILGSGSVEPL